MKFSKGFLFLSLIIVFLFLVSCDFNEENKKNDNDQNQISYIEITSSNASQFFNMNVSIDHRNYDTGYILYYEIKINLIGNYELSSNVTFKIKTRVDYWVTHAVTTVTLTMKKGTNNISKKGSISLAKKVSQINNLAISCECIEASGKIK